MKKTILWLVLILLVGVAGFTYWGYLQENVSTDDAHLEPDVVEVVSNVKGRVSHVYIDANQYVTKDQLLFDMSAAATHVVAPASGFVENITVKEGTVVRANQPLFEIISNAYYWVDAKFSAADSALIRPGQKVAIHTDIYADEQLEGIIDSIKNDGSGLIRVHILNPPKIKPLRLGTSATVTVYVNTN